MTIYGFYYISCIYESGAVLHSAHLTKRGAYRAMRKFLIAEYESRRDGAVKAGLKHFRGEKYFEHQDYFIKPIEVKQ